MNEMDSLCLLDCLTVFNITELYLLYLDFFEWLKLVGLESRGRRQGQPVEALNILLQHIFIWHRLFSRLCKLKRQCHPIFYFTFFIKQLLLERVAFLVILWWSYSNFKSTLRCSLHHNAMSAWCKLYHGVTEKNDSTTERQTTEQLTTEQKQLNN